VLIPQYVQEKCLSSMTEGNLILLDKDTIEEQNVLSPVETIHLSAFSDNKQGEYSTPDMKNTRKLRLYADTRYAIDIILEYLG
ncbi:5768_t:CDS:2, partial [Gigaspora rosea]